MLKILFSCIVSLLLLSAAGCGEKQIMLMNAPLDTGDKVDYPPSEEELSTPKSFVAFLPVQFAGKSFSIPQSPKCKFCTVCS
jgi:hypothetical protein